MLIGYIAKNRGVQPSQAFAIAGISTSSVYDINQGYDTTEAYISEEPVAILSVTDSTRPRTVSVVAYVGFMIFPLRGTA